MKTKVRRRAARRPASTKAVSARPPHRVREGVSPSRRAGHAGSDFDEYVAGVEASLGPGARDVLNAFRGHYTLASQLIELRRANHLTQQQVARKAGVDQSEISRLERGMANATKATLDRIGRVFGVTVGFLPAPG